MSDQLRLDASTRIVCTVVSSTKAGDPPHVKISALHPYVSRAEVAAALAQAQVMLLSQPGQIIDVDVALASRIAAEALAAVTPKCGARHPTTTTPCILPPEHGGGHQTDVIGGQMRVWSDDPDPASPPDGSTPPSNPAE